MKVIIAGCRGITDYEIIRQAMIASGYWRQFGKKIEVVSGTASGADKLGEEFARRNGLVCHRFPANWNKYGAAAGMIRNAEMGKFALAHGGRLLAIWDGVSTGTKGMVAWADKNGLERFVFEIEWEKQ